MSSDDIFKTLARCMGQPIDEKKDMNEKNSEKFFAMKTQFRCFNSLEEARSFAQDRLFIRIGYQLLPLSEIRSCRIISQNILDVFMSNDNSARWGPEGVVRFFINPIYADDILEYILHSMKGEMSTWKKEWSDNNIENKFV